MLIQTADNVKPVPDQMVQRNAMWAYCNVHIIDVKTFLRFFYFCHVFVTFLNTCSTCFLVFIKNVY